LLFMMMIMMGCYNLLWHPDTRLRLIRNVSRFELLTRVGTKLPIRERTKS
jgi:hypothetical protein